MMAPIAGLAMVAHHSLGLRRRQPNLRPAALTHVLVQGLPSLRPPVTTVMMTPAPGSITFAGKAPARLPAARKQVRRNPGSPAGPGEQIVSAFGTTHRQRNSRSLVRPRQRRTPL